MSKRILLTGATGYLGSHLAIALLDAGHTVVALKRQTSSLRRLAPILPRITLLDVEGLDLRALFKDLGKIDAVIHTATCYGRNGESASQIADANLNFPLKLLDAAVATDVPLFLNTDTALDKFLNAYSLSKTQFAEWGSYFARQKNIRFINLRLEHFYGFGDDDTKFTTHVINNCLMNAPELKLTSGEQRRDFIYIDDVVAAYMLLLEKQEAIADWLAEFDVGSGEAVTIRQFVETVHRLTNSETRLNFGAHPYREGEVMLSQADTKSLRKLGWCCRHTLEQGLKLVIEGNNQ
ncbi:MAG: NAD(P)-dependent oxidoreductase [Sideroxydans sp.]|nr:NAD(P)-dependent oxidoreductase [Sideroxydans sp.]